MKKGLKLILIGLLLITMCSLCAIASGEANDVPVVSLSTPTQLSTVQSWDGNLISMVATAVIPSGDVDSNLVNATLYANYTTNINYTGFTGWQNGTVLTANETILFNGTSNTTSFNYFKTVTNGAWADNTYITWNVLVCNQQNNCTYASNNYSFMIDRDFDSTAGQAKWVTPANNTVTTKAAGSVQLNYTATDNTYIQNATLYFNCTNNVTNIVWVKNETQSNTGALSPFDSNSANITILGNFTKWSDSVADGVCYFRVLSCDYNNNCKNSSDTGMGGDLKITLDRTKPTLTTFANASTTDTCDNFYLKFNVSESSNLSVYYSKDITAFSNLSNTASVYDTSSANATRTINLTGLLGNTNYYYNITICDLYGNCNATAQTATTNSFYKEWSACEGWNAYAILDTKVSLDDIANNITSAMTVSWFNESSQSFKSYVPGISTNRYINLSRGDAVMVETDNNSWVNIKGFLTTTNTSIKALPVYVRLSNWTNLGQLNEWTLGNISSNTQILGNLTYLFLYNNTAQRYQDHIYSRLWNNDTVTITGTSVWVWGDKMAGYWCRNETFNATLDWWTTTGD